MNNLDVPQSFASKILKKYRPDHFYNVTNNDEITFNVNKITSYGYEFVDSNYLDESNVIMEKLILHLILEIGR